MYKIQANQSGTRSIEVSDQHLETIEKYQLLRNLVDSNGIIDEEVLDKLKLNVRSLLESSDIKDKDLLDLPATMGTIVRLQQFPEFILPWGRFELDAQVSGWFEPVDRH